MTARSHDRAARAGLLLWLPAIVLATSVLHELGHWTMGVALGHEMRLSLNEVAPIDRAIPARDLLLIAAAGPLVTFAQAVCAALLIGRRGPYWLYGVLFAAWFMRLAAAFVSVSHPNDEARIALWLSGTAWWLPLAVVLGLSALLVAASRRLRIGWKTNLACYLICSATLAAIVFVDRLL